MRKFLVTEPILTKTVSNIMVSSENSRVAEGSVRRPSFLQEDTDVIAKTVIISIFIEVDSRMEVQI